MKHILIVFIALVALSCGGEERIVDNSNPNWKLMVSTDEVESKLALFQMPAGELLSEDIYFESNGESLPGKVVKIVLYREEIYLVIPSAKKILAINKLSYEKVAEYDFSNEGLEPIDICFPNSTDAYVAHGNDSKFSILDIYNKQIFTTDTLSGTPVAIVNSGNQVFTANPGNNNLSVIDVREHEQVDILETPDVPYYLDVAVEGKFLVLVSAGHGKIDEAVGTEARLSIYDISLRQKITEVILQGPGINSLDDMPGGLLTTYFDNAFIPVGSILLQLNLQVNKLVPVFQNSYDAIYYNAKKQKLLLTKRLEGSTLFISSSIQTGIEESIKELPVEASALLAL